jgi:hypothetical protein
MNAVLQSLQPPTRHTNEDEEDAWGYGNLNESGGVRGMMVPRVPDVSRLSLIIAAAGRQRVKDD